MKMKNTTSPVSKAFLLIVGSLLVHAASAQTLPRNSYGFSMPGHKRGLRIPQVESTTSGSMLRQWPHATESAGAGNEKSLGELLAQHPELSTHSHMTYTPTIRIGERARLQPPGSEFSH